jgi:hypothetical protein
MDKIAELKQKCLEQIESPIAIPRDQEAPYILAYAVLCIAEKLTRESAPAKQHAKKATS